MLYATGRVTVTFGDEACVSAEVLGSSRPYDVTLRRERDDILAACKCPFFESEGICKHIWATVLAADKIRYLAHPKGLRARSLVEDFDEFDGDDDQPFELKSPSPLTAWKKDVKPVAPPPPARWKTLLAQIQPALVDRQFCQCPLTFSEMLVRWCFLPG